MKLLKRLRFAVKYNFDEEFVVVPPNANEVGAIRFLEYDKADGFVDSTPLHLYPPRIFVAVNKIKP